jgi:hypothetical protein
VNVTPFFSSEKMLQEAVEMTQFYHPYTFCVNDENSTFEINALV